MELKSVVARAEQVMGEIRYIRRKRGCEEGSDIIMWSEKLLRGEIPLASGDRELPATRDKLLDYLAHKFVAIEFTWEEREGRVVYTNYPIIDPGDPITEADMYLMRSSVLQEVIEITRFFLAYTQKEENLSDRTARRQIEILESRDLCG